MEKKKEILNIRHLDVKFNVRSRILNAIRDITLSVYEGETLAIVGESGSGKSVLTKTFAGMLDDNGFISHGRIIFKQDDLSRIEIPLDKSNKKLLSSVQKRLDEYSYLEFGAQEYNELTKLEKYYKTSMVLSSEEQEEYEKRLKNLNDDLIDNKNKLSTLSTRTEEEKASYNKLKEEIKLLEDELDSFIKEHEEKVKVKKKAFLNDKNKVEEFKKKKENLIKTREKKISDAKKEPLPEEIKKRNHELAAETVLSISRYPIHLKVLYKKRLLKGFKQSMSEGRDLFTDKRRNRVFDKVSFRVEYRGNKTEEGNEVKKIIEEKFVKALKQDVVDDPALENSTLLSQAVSLHPHLRKSIIKKLRKIMKNDNHNYKLITNRMDSYFEYRNLFDLKWEDNVKRIADMIMLFISRYDLYYSCKRASDLIIKWIKKVYDSNMKDFSCDYKSKPITYLKGFALIDCAKVRYTKDWQKIRGCQIATVFQDPMTSLNPIIPIGRQIVMVIQKHQKCSQAEARARAIKMMEKVGIPDPEKRFNDYPFQYSGGMRQRIVIAIALSCQPKILICDEPTTALDVTIQAQIIRLIKKLSKDLGFTTVFITHDLGVVANVADRVAVLYGGQIVELGTVEDIFYDPKHPYTWALLSSLPQLSEAGKELFSISGTPPSLYNKIVGDSFAPRNEYALAIDFVKEPPMFEVNSHHFAKTWLLDPRSPKIEKPQAIENLHQKMVNVYKDEL